MIKKRITILENFFIKDLGNPYTEETIRHALMKADLDNPIDNPFFALSEKEMIQEIQKNENKRN